MCMSHTFISNKYQGYRGGGGRGISPLHKFWVCIMVSSLSWSEIRDCNHFRLESVKGVIFEEDKSLNGHRYYR